jgi:hypothetical protein
LEFDCREAAGPQCQAARTPTDHARRLCADAAAGLYRAEAAGESVAGARGAAARAQTYSGRRRSAEGRRRAFPVRAAAAPSEVEFKRAYARARGGGLTREQAVRVYSFETGGNGNHDMQSGLSASRPGSRAISTAIGYNQLLTTNSVELIAEQGHESSRR